MKAAPASPPSPPQAPGLNPDLVRQYAAGASDFGQAQLLTLFDYLRRSEQRAADLSRSYLQRIAELERRLSAAPDSMPKAAEGRKAARQTPASPPGPKASVELDLSDI